MTNTKAIAISYDEVLGAVTGLQTEEKKVTILAVRERLGRGSFTTVKKLLDRWQESQSAPAASLSRVPPQLGSLWDEARKVAQAEFQDDRAALEQFARELEEKFQALEQRAKDAEQLRDLAETRLADLQVALVGSQAQVQDLVAQRDAAQTLTAESLTQAARERQALAEMLSRRLDQLVEAAGAQSQALSHGLGAMHSQAERLETSLQRNSAVLAEAMREVSVGQAEAWPKIEHQLDVVVRQVRRSGGVLHQIIRAPHHGRALDARASSHAGRTLATRVDALERVRRLRRAHPEGPRFDREESNAR
jgi:chromosome segregation ATPase